MVRRLVIAGALTLSAVPAAADPIDDFVARQMETSHIPGVAIAIVEKGRVSSVRAYGTANLEWQIPVDGDTAFQLASATKLFTGVLLMRLAEQGRLSVDDPVARFFDDAPAAWQRIRVLQLANHSSGLSDNLGTPRPTTLEGLLAALKKAPLAYEPGTDARYGISDFLVLRAVLEKASGKSFEALLEDEIVKPLQLRATRFAWMKLDGPIQSMAVVPRRASVYAWAEGTQRLNSFTFGVPGQAAGGLFSSANDLAAFFAALDQGRLLKPESVATLQRAAVLPGGKPNGFGVGWTVRKYHGVTVVGHSGGPALADIMRVPDRELTIIALANQQNYYPLLAEGIGDFFLPAPPLPKGIRDADPAGAAKLGAVLDAAREGRLDATAFAPASQAAMLEFHRGFGRNLLIALGAVRSAILLSDERSDGVRKRRYRVQFESRPMDWMLETLESGAVQGLYPIAEQ